MHACFSTCLCDVALHVRYRVRLVIFRPGFCTWRPKGFPSCFPVFGAISHQVIRVTVHCTLPGLCDHCIGVSDLRLGLQEKGHPPVEALSLSYTNII